MICFRDMSFCSAKCSVKKCPRKFDENQREQSRKWWKQDPDNAPIAFGDFSEMCDDYEVE